MEKKMQQESNARVEINKLKQTKEATTKALQKVFTLGNK